MDDARLTVSMLENMFPNETELIEMLVDLYNGDYTFENFTVDMKEWMGDYLHSLKH
jgi:hypothetical protein|tara:strand:+ start:1588 stop:1755 length:168 start_codon:yes stop_codon:yes gene_type:complete